MEIVLVFITVSMIWISLTRIQDLRYRLRRSEINNLTTIREHGYLQVDYRKLKEMNEELEYEIKLLKGERIYYAWANTLSLYAR